jgi:hypothetical protein
VSKLDHLSPSLLKTAGKCGMQVYYFWVEKLKLAPGIAKSFGTSFHKATLDLDQAHKIATGAYRPIEELKQAFTDDFRAVIPECEDNDPEAERFGGKDQAYVVYQKQGLHLLDAYNVDRSILNGRAVEVAFSIPFADTKLDGRIDVDVSDTLFKDVKTKDMTRKYAKKATEKDYGNDRQFDAYAAAKWKMSGQEAQDTTAVMSYITGNGGILQEIKTPRTIEDHKRTEELAYRVNQMIEKDVYLPVDKGSAAGWVCSAKYCGAYLPRPGFAGCPFGARGRVS